MCYIVNDMVLIPPYSAFFKISGLFHYFATVDRLFSSFICKHKNSKILQVRLIYRSKVKTSLDIGPKKAKIFLKEFMEKKISNHFAASFQNHKCRRLLKQYFPILVAVYECKKSSNLSRNYKNTTSIKYVQSKK